jgi:hypothetical protein
MCPDCKKRPNEHGDLPEAFEERMGSLKVEIGLVKVENANRKVFFAMVDKCAEMAEEAKATWLEAHECPAGPLQG